MAGGIKRTIVVNRDYEITWKRQIYDQAKTLTLVFKDVEGRVLSESASCGVYQFLIPSFGMTGDTIMPHAVGVTRLSLGETSVVMVVAEGITLALSPLVLCVTGVNVRSLQTNADSEVSLCPVTRYLSH